MKKFLIWYQKDPTAIVEVEVEKLSYWDDPWVALRKPGEWAGRVFAPNFVAEKDKVSGKMMPYEACDFVFHDSVEEARATIFRNGLMSILKKKYYKTLEEKGEWTTAETSVMIGLISGSEDIDKVVSLYKEDLEKQISEIEVIML